MKLSAPKEVTFIIAVILGVLGVLASRGIIHTGYAFTMVTVGFILLILGNIVKGL